MSYQRFKNNSYCVGGKHYSSTNSIRGDYSHNKKTGVSLKLLRGTQSWCLTLTYESTHDAVIQTSYNEGLTMA